MAVLMQSWVLEIIISINCSLITEIWEEERLVVSIHLHLQSLSHVLDKVCRLLAITFFLVWGDPTSSGGRIGELLIRKIPPISPSWRRHHWLKIKPEVKIAVLASSWAPLESDWCKLLNLFSWLADKSESRSDWREGSYSGSSVLPVLAGWGWVVWFGGFTVQCGHH